LNQLLSVEALFPRQSEQANQVVGDTEVLEVALREVHDAPLRQQCDMVGARVPELEAHCGSTSLGTGWADNVPVAMEMVHVAPPWLTASSSPWLWS
jgi:hypothetical protein